MRHLEDGRLFREATNIYYEFPPLVSHKMMPNARSDPYYQSPSITEDRKDFNNLRMVTQDELKHYLHLAYVHLKEFVTSARRQK